MLTCLRCGIPTPRLTVAQIHCPQCQREVLALIASDERRRSVVRFLVARETTRAAA